MPERARPLLERSLNYWKQEDNPRNRVVICFALASVLKKLKEEELAGKILQEALKDATASDDQELIDSVQNMMGQ
jgi:hypothetical protein